MAKTNPPGSSDAARRAAQQCFTRAQEVFKSGDVGYSIKLLKDACKLAPDQLVYRQYLRGVQKRKFDNNKKGSKVAGFTTMASRTQLKASKAKKDWLRALEHCEDILSENPWDSGVLLDEAAICEELDWMEMAVWVAESALERDPMDASVNRTLAVTYERIGAF